MSLTRRFQRSAWRREHKGEQWGIMMFRAQRARRRARNDARRIAKEQPLGSLITLTVQNTDANTRDFRAAFFGTSLG